MGSVFYTIIDALYNPKRKEFMGRDGAGWAKLATFYFLFYLGLAGFFCFLLTVFMISLPRDQPRYYAEISCMHKRTKPFSPGLSFRPQIGGEGNIIVVNMKNGRNESDPYVKSLKQYLDVFYWRQDRDRLSPTNKFTISNPGDCTAENQYGFSNGKPCILIKMNKIFNFLPKPGHMPEDEQAFKAAGCRSDPNAVAIHCYRDYSTPAEHLGNITYISENSHDSNCGSIETKWFPYKGKKERQDVYQAPYVWVQFQELKPNVSVNVICRIFGANIPFDKSTNRAVARFKLQLKDSRRAASSKTHGEI